MTKVINLLAGPGSGKSSTAAGLFHLMKYNGVKCELVTEYAKELYYDGTLNDRSINPLVSIFAEQNKRLERLRGKVDFIITDGPIILTGYYGEQDGTRMRMVLNSHHDWNNINYFINRVKPYAKYGRGQDEKDAIKIDAELREMFYQLGIDYKEVKGDISAAENIFYDLIERGEISSD